MNLACAHCGAHTSMPKLPAPGDMLFCIYCGGIAVWDAAGHWRDMTKEEHQERMDHPGYLAAADHLMTLRIHIERDRDAMARVVEQRLRGRVYPWLRTQIVATEVANALLRSGFHGTPVEETPDGP
jgi:hypothetical protein